ncbi:MAG: hypothetical protein LM577_02300 [Thermoproteaceae archaeon]|nr:hypothetical protein [Thermoproteaceae archaeon]
MRFGWKCANTSMAVCAVTGDGFFAGYWPNQGISFHWYMGQEQVRPGSCLSSFAAGWGYWAYPVEHARDFIVLARTSMYSGCQAREEVADAVTPFKSIRKACRQRQGPGQSGQF